MYWSQDKVYLYATCALFPEKLLRKHLASQKLKAYIPYYFDVEEQIKVLDQLQKDGLLVVTVTRKDDENAEYFIQHIEHKMFMSTLKDYLEKYRNDELVRDNGYQLEKFTENNDRLTEYLSFSSRKQPIVNPMNIWNNWSPFNSSPSPFWEVVLTYSLVDSGGKITSIDRGDSDISVPSATIITHEKEAESSVSLEKSTKPCRQEEAELRLKNGMLYIELKSGGKYKLKKFRTDAAPANFINYMILHQKTDINKADIQTKVDNCKQKENMTELVRQCGFTGNLLFLKKVFFAGTTAKKVRFTNQGELTAEQIKVIEENLIKSG